MPDTLLNVFEEFCDDLPETVRNDLLFMMLCCRMRISSS